MISLTKKQMESSFVSFCEAIFRLPEIESIKVRTVTGWRRSFTPRTKTKARISSRFGSVMTRIGDSRQNASRSRE